MAFLLRLPLMLIELLLRRLFGGEADERAYAVAPDAPPAPAATPEPMSTAPSFTGEPSRNGAPPPPTADEAIQRRSSREAEAAAAPDPTPPTPLRPVGGAAAAGHVDTEPELVQSFGDPDEVGGTITIDEPWPGYDGDSAGSIVTRLRGADPATKGVVALYETANKGRKTVLKAAG